MTFSLPPSALPSSPKRDQLHESRGWAHKLDNSLFIFLTSTSRYEIDVYYIQTLNHINSFIVKPSSNKHEKKMTHIVFFCWSCFFFHFHFFNAFFLSFTVIETLCYVVCPPNLHVTAHHPDSMPKTEFRALHWHTLAILYNEEKSISTSVKTTAMQRNIAFKSSIRVACT